MRASGVASAIGAVKPEPHERPLVEHGRDLGAVWADEYGVLELRG